MVFSSALVSLDKKSISQRDLGNPAEIYTNVKIVCEELSLHQRSEKYQKINLDLQNNLKLEMWNENESYFEKNQVIWRLVIFYRIF